MAASITWGAFFLGALVIGPHYSGSTVGALDVWKLSFGSCVGPIPLIVRVPHEDMVGPNTPTVLLP